ncbi:MAG: aminotransferase class V-fold PLP-dependent enzyme, partial [Clostridia bacterium]|nr:aminotransferase class V-fold PLP-dependent enzyme [Clostridia bacterium]
MIYLDNSATTPVSEDVAEVMSETAANCFGNPSSLHGLGLGAEHIVSDARKAVLNALGVSCRAAKNLIFTSGGSEADSLAILGCMYSKQSHRGKRAVFGSSEHPAVYECARRLEEDGFDVVFLSSKNGRIDMDELCSVITPRTVFFSHMQVNNETGAVYDIKTAFAEAKKINPDIITHTDAVQSFMKTEKPVGACGADMISVSGHKIFAPKGIGALYVSDRVIRTKNLRPIILGGGQENGMRSGTENVIGIAALGQAVRHSFDIS